MAQTIKLKRGLEAARAGITPAVGEIIYTTDNKEIFLGDGTTAGGTEIGYLNKRLGGTIGGSLTITGDLTVNGTTTSVNSTQVNIGDNIIILNALYSGSTPSASAGFEVERGTLANTSFLWNEGAGQWQITDTASTRRILDTNDIASFATSTHNHTLDSLSNVTITANSTGEILKWNGTAWINNTLAEAGIQALDADLTAIGALAGTVGLLKKTAANTWTLDTTAYTTNTGTVTSVTSTSAAITVATGTTTPALTHSTADGYLHVPATGTTNNGKVLMAGATAGSLSWVTPSDGITNLGYTPSATNGIVTSSTGTNATIPLADGTNAGLLAPALYTKLNSGVITSVVGGDGLTASTVAGVATVNVVALDASIVVAADSISVGVIDGGTF